MNNERNELETSETMSLENVAENQEVNIEESNVESLEEQTQVVEEQNEEIMQEEVANSDVGEIDSETLMEESEELDGTENLAGGETEVDNNQVQEKKPSVFKVFFSNLCYRLSYTPALGFVGIASLICFLGLLYFSNLKRVGVGNEELVSSCIIMLVVFAVFFAVFLDLLILSIVLNIIRRRQGKK